MDADWTVDKLAGTTWGAKRVIEIPGLLGPGTISVDVAITFNSDKSYTLEPTTICSPNAREGIKDMVKTMMDSANIAGIWKLDGSLLMLSNKNPKTGEWKNSTAMIQGDSITASMPSEGIQTNEPMVFTQRY